MCCVLFWRKRETHKQNSQEISGKCRDSPGITPGQSGEMFFFYVFPCLLAFPFPKKASMCQTCFDVPCLLVTRALHRWSSSAQVYCAKVSSWTIFQPRAAWLRFLPVSVGLALRESQRTLPYFSGRVRFGSVTVWEGNSEKRLIRLTF